MTVTFLLIGPTEIIKKHDSDEQNWFLVTDVSAVCEYRPRQGILCHKMLYSPYIINRPPEEDFAKCT